MKQDQARGIALILLLISVIFIAPRIMAMAIVPGPEGLNVELYGVQFGEYSNNFWKIGEISNNQILESGTVEETIWVPGSFWSGTARADMKIRCSFPDPRNTLFRKDVHVKASYWPLEAEGDYYTSLQIERERPTVSEVNIHGDPLGGSESPTHIRYLEYHTPRITEGNQITFTKYCIHVVPVDFIIQMSVRGEKALGWSDTHLWFKLNTIVWRNAFTESQVEEIQDSLDKNPPEGAEISAYNYRGGFPIWGWIGEWDPLVWYDEEEREDQPPEEALDNVRIYPSLEGREITLYTEPIYGEPNNPEDFEEYEYPDGAGGGGGGGGAGAGSILLFDDFDPEDLEEALIGEIAALPDPDFATTVYTPIYIEKFYPYYEESGWGPWYRLEQWYPTVFMRVRLLYAIYGEFVYLWTEEEAEDQGYEWEWRYSQYKYEEGPWLSLMAGLGSWLVSPSGIISMLLLLGAIALAVIILVNPAILFSIFGMKKKGRR